MKIFDLTSRFVTRGQKEDGIYLGPWNQDRWMSQQRTHKFEYVFCCWWTNQELKQYTVKVELLKPTTPKNCIFMPFLDTNSHLTTKLYNFDIKCQSNSESYDRHIFFGTKFRGGQNLLITVGGFFNAREYSEADWLVPVICTFKYLFRSLRIKLLQCIYWPFQPGFSLYYKMYFFLFSSSLKTRRGRPRW